MAEVISPVVAAYAHGNTVTVSIYRMDGTPEVSGASCTEIGSSGRFYYQPVFTPPATKTSYLVVFTNTVYEQTSELVLGGYDYQAAAAASSFIGAGVGSVLKTYTQLLDGLPLPDCQVWMSTDLLQANIIAGGITDALGKVYLYPNVPTGTTLYVWRRKSGYEFTNPDVETM